MQNFWWNRKFYHGKDEPDSFRLHRLEEEQKTAVTAVESLTKAQTVLERLLSEQGTLLSEHTTLLADLTTIAAVLQEGLDNVAAECESIDGELLALEENDQVLSTRLEGIEEACADTAAEQETKLNELSRTTQAKLATLEEKTTVIDAMETSLKSQQALINELKTKCSTGTVYFNGQGINAILGGAYPASAMTLYNGSGVVQDLFLVPGTETQVFLPEGEGALLGRAESLEVKEGMLTELNLSGMLCLKKLTLRYGSFESVRLSTLPHLTDLTVEGVSGNTIDLTGQTELSGLKLSGNSVELYFPENLDNLVFVELDADYGSNETFLSSLLPDRSGRDAGYIFLGGATPPSWLSSRNWEVLG